MGEKKIPRWLRKMNIGYQVVLSVLGAANLTLSMLDDSVNIPKVYYEICATLLSVIPVFWTKMLDGMKQYQADLTPENSPSSSINLDTLPPNSP